MSIISQQHDFCMYCFYATTLISIVHVTHELIEFGDGNCLCAYDLVMSYLSTIATIPAFECQAEAIGIIGMYGFG